MDIKDLKNMNGRRVRLAEAVISDDNPGAWGTVTVTFGSKQIYCLPADAVVEILPEEIGVEDMVSHKSYPSKGRVKAIDGEAAAIAWEGGAKSWSLLEDLTLVSKGTK